MSLPHKTLTQKKRALAILHDLKKVTPDAGMILAWSNHFELLVAVILSAQCTDKQVNVVTEKLFKKYKTLDDYVNALPKEFEKDIFSTGFYRSKTRHILITAKLIKEKFGGKVPNTMDELLTLRGVSRKTANVVLGNAFGIVEGIAVDTHVTRLARLFGLTKEHDPKKIERDLMALLPQKEWFPFTYYIIEYGRKYCTARVKEHSGCPLAKYEIFTK